MLAAPANINDHFFDGLYKDVWKHIIPPGLTEVEAEFIIESSSLKPGSMVLDLMCGYGRHSLELARKGARATAVDNQPDYIKEIAEIASADSLPVEAVLSSALDFQSADTFDAVICMGNSFSFFSPAEAESLLLKVSSWLKPGGLFLINSWTIAEIALKYFREKDWHYAGPYKCIVESRYQFIPSRIEFEHTVVSPEGRVEVLEGVDYIHTLNELQQMFRAAGLSIEGVYSTPKKKKFVVGDVRAYIMAKKAI
jgi:cyclopropane fatty-acyl-phospholipid synthase-like methyltransferase